MKFSKIKFEKGLYKKGLRIGKIVGFTTLSQGLIQGFAFLSGIFIIRFLSKDEYSYYTLANTMLAMMTVLADSGISSGVMAKGGQYWREPNKLGIILNTGLALRSKFSKISILVTLPILIYLLLDHGADWTSIIFIILFLVPAFYAAISDSLLEVIPKLHQDIFALQRNKLIVAIGRAILTVSSLFFFPMAYLAILASALPRMYGNFKLRKIAGKYADLNQQTDNVIRLEILVIVKKMLPGAIYFCLSGQITIWIISFFGSTDSIAEVGALSRFSMILGLFSIVFTTLIVPRFAKLPVNKIVLLKFLVVITILTAALLAAIWLFFWAFPTQILWILGDDYGSLQFELLLSIAAGLMGVFTGMFFSLSSSRGWVLDPKLLIISNILTVLLAAFYFDVSTVEGVLKFNLVVIITPFLLNSIFCFYKILQTSQDKNDYAV